MSASSGMLTDRIWNDPAPDLGETALDEIRHKLSVSEGFARVLAARDLLDVQHADHFLNPCETQLHDPWLMAGMDDAVARIERAIDSFEKVVIFGDYDVDGTASTAILYNYLKRLGARVHYFIPDRMADGYGLNPGTVDKIKAGGADLVITVDNGSTAIEESRYVASLGMDLIVTDHHKMGEERPTCVALVNPQQDGCGYPFSDLSATGVAFKIVCALDERLTARGIWDTRGICHTHPTYYLDLVALATVADMSPLVGENRVLVKLGLELINQRPRPGLAGLIRECNCRTGISPSTINFKLAPKINALGRIGDPRMGIQMLLARSFTEGRRLARHLAMVNRARQEIERNVLASANKQLEGMPERGAIVLIGADWHPGVIGIIATRVSYQYQRPTAVITLANKDQALGSVRGSGTMNVLEALGACAALLDRFGGHTNAAGLALPPQNVGAFNEQFITAVEECLAGAAAPKARSLDIDTWIHADLLTEQFMGELGRLSPFGYGNPEPVVGVRGLHLNHPAVTQNRNLRFCLANSGRSNADDAVAWDQAEWTRHLNGAHDVVITPQMQYGPEGPRSQFKVVDLRAS